MDIKIVDDEPYQIINIKPIETKDANNSLESAYTYFIQSSHQLLRYCLYAKHKKIEGYKRFTNDPSENEIISDLYDVLSDIYSVAKSLYNSSPSVEKYDCFELVDSLKSDKLPKLFKVDKEFERMAAMYQMDAAQVEGFMPAEQKESMKKDLAVQKAVDFLLEQAKLTEASDELDFEAE